MSGEPGEVGDSGEKGERVKIYVFVSSFLYKMLIILTLDFFTSLVTSCWKAYIAQNPKVTICLQWRK